MNISALLEQTARRLPDCPAVTQDGRTLTYRQFNSAVAGFAGALRGHFGLAKGNRVALAMDNCTELLLALFAIWRAGLVAVPMNAKLHGRELIGLITDSGAALCLTSPKQAAAIRAEPEFAQHARFLFDATDPAFVALCKGDGLDVTPMSPDDLALLFYTSGTTGKSKGAMLTHRNLMFSTTSYLADIDQLDERDTIFHAAPLTHGSGIYALPHIAKGSHNLILSGSFDPDEVLSALGEHQNVSMFAAPTMVNRLVRQVGRWRGNLSSLKCMIYGGGPMHVQDLKEALEVLGPRFYQLFGQGESPMTITGLDKFHHEKAMRDHRDDWLASCGPARTGVEVMVVDDDGQPLPPGELGEVVTRSDCVMAGYWRNRDATAAALRNGWLHTGDSGKLDEQGFLTLLDRKKDLIISGGSNIYPREIEEVLLEHAGVREVAVIGEPDREWGELVVACIVTNASNITADELDTLCLNRLARFKRPRRYVFLEDLPKNSYGKVLKRELRGRI